VSEPAPTQPPSQCGWCQSCGEMIPFPVREREDEETWLRCRQCETWSDFRKQPKAMYLTPRQRAKLD
jgi:hypothetical protein